MGMALRSMPALRELDLANNHIDDLGVIAITLSLRRPEAGDADTDDSSAAAEQQQRGKGTPTLLALETIDLRGNHISDWGASNILEFLTNITNEAPVPLLCPRLASIYLDDNPAVRSPDGRAALQKMQAVTGIAWAYAEVW